MKKVFKVAHIRDLEKQVIKGQITYSRMVEIMNEMAHEAYIKVEKLPIHGVVHLLKRAVFERRNGIGYLTFTPEGLKVPTTIPVITKGNRDKANAWTWNGCLEKPTVRPSIRTTYTNDKGKQTEIHYWLNDGICQCLGDCKDGNSGKNIPLKECEG
jgi:hypothetical protein